MIGPVLFFAVFFGYPVASIISRGLGESGLSRAQAVFEDPAIQEILWFTLWQALASTVLTLLIALPGAYIFARLHFRGKALLRALVTVPFVLPTTVVGAAFLGLLGQNGITDQWFGFTGDRTVFAILLAHVFFNYAVVVRTVGGLWAHLDPRQAEAARTLGAGPWRAFTRVTLPQLAPAVGAAALLVFLFTFTSFGVVQILGGPQYATLEVEIYRQTAQLLDLPTAAILSLLQLLTVGAVLGIHAYFARRRARALRLVPATQSTQSVRGRRWFFGLNLAAMIVLLGAPLAVLVERSFSTGDGYGLRYWRELARNDTDSTLFVPAIEAVGNSIYFAALATLIALIVGSLAAFALSHRPGKFTKAFDAMLMLPLGVSAVTVGFGFLIALDEPPLDLRDSPLLIPLAQALVAVPFVVRTMAPVLSSIDERLREAARVLGASPWRVWRTVDLPLVWRSGLVATGFAFAISLGEFGATVFIARPDQPTVPVAIYRLLGRPGELNYGQAMALSVLLAALCAAALLLLERIRLPRSGEM
ncbi:MAG: iron ABC transporter permease [Corynebacteriales bacterium]|nr:iron ABC transporter permease [Mycobacteriales bacterium]